MSQTAFQKQVQEGALGEEVTASLCRLITTERTYWIEYMEEPSSLSPYS